MSRGYEDDYDAERPEAHEPAEAFADEERPASGAKIVLPGALLIATGVINLLCAAYLFVNAYVVGRMSLDEYQKTIGTMWNAEQMKQLEQQGYPPEVMKDLSVKTYYGWGGLGVLGSLLTVIGGICMCARKGWGLAMGTAVVNLIPCVLSPCCCLGMPIGLWALLVLLQRDVKAAFR
jgi:hypothetical protein